jgi:predicted dehydrogenase
VTPAVETVRRGRVRYGIVGHGWRADFYLRLARQSPEHFQCVGVVTRGAETGARLEREWGVRTYRRVEDLVADARPEVVVTSVPREANPDVVRAVVESGVAVLSETPPAPDIAGLRRLWSAVGESDLVQVAEQHPFLPVVAAIRGLVGLGALGTPTFAQVSWTHDYHAMALLRSLLGVGSEQVRVSAVGSHGPLLEGPAREGRPAAPQVVDTAHTLAVLEMAAAIAVYDFTDGQWFNPLRRRHLVLRGSRGEVVDNDVTWIGADGSTLRSSIVRHQTGFNGDLEGADLDTLSWGGTVLYRNPYPGARMSDEEIAIASCLEATGVWRRGEGPPPYPLADACQDHLLSLRIHESVDRGTPVVAHEEPWSAHVRKDAGVAVGQPPLTAGVAV